MNEMPEADLLAISEREVLDAAKVLLACFRRNPYGAPRTEFKKAEAQLLDATALLEERERVRTQIETEKGILK